VRHSFKGARHSSGDFSKTAILLSHYYNIKTNFMARKTVRVEIAAKKPDEFSKQLNEVKDYDDSLGANSVLQQDPDIDMGVFAKSLAQADSLRKQSEAARKLSEDLMQQARTIYGTAVGQTIQSPGTLYSMLDTIKQSLLKKYKGNEETLSNYGFNVVIGQAKSPVKKTTTAAGENK
jgi:hypothetical protein